MSEDNTKRAQAWCSICGSIGFYNNLGDAGAAELQHQVSKHKAVLHENPPESKGTKQNNYGGGRPKKKSGWLKNNKPYR